MRNCHFCQEKTNAYECMQCASLKWSAIGFCLRCRVALERKDWAINKNNYYYHCPFCIEEGIEEREITLA